MPSSFRETPMAKYWVFAEHTLNGERCWLVSRVLNESESPNVRLRMARIGGAVKHRERHMLFTHTSFLGDQATAELLPVATELSGNLPLANAIPLAASRVELGPRRTIVKILSMASGGGEIHGNLSGAVTDHVTSMEPCSRSLHTATFDEVLDPSACGTWDVDKETGRLFGHVVDGKVEATLAIIMPSGIVFRHAAAFLDLLLALRPQKAVIWKNNVRRVGFHRDNGVIE
ncbi:hypothetical protein CCMA1212_003163 [Trichoderma ghanense]|uniref:Uncharacterized protein n=1 Tax=Trichoderma ghanense TaxID=65468 RepID=A0ABY2H8R6_9HYPO